MGTSASVISYTEPMDCASMHADPSVWGFNLVAIEKMAAPSPCCFLLVPPPAPLPPPGSAQIVFAALARYVDRLEGAALSCFACSPVIRVLGHRCVVIECSDNSCICICQRCGCFTSG